jgi:hypothetical protein
MANTNAPFGFRQYSGNGSAPTYEQVAVRIAYNASNIFYGDPVEPDANGNVVRGDGTTGNAGIAGIFIGCQYLSVAQKRTVWSNYWPGSDVASNQYVTGYIVNDPNARFVAQNNSASAIGVDSVNANIGYDIGTGNTANGISGATVDRASIDVTATLPFRIVGLVQDPPGAPGTDITSGYNYVIVAFNNVSTKSLTGI